MTEFIAHMLWVAIGDYYEEHWPLPEAQYELLCAAQLELESLLTWGTP